MEKVRGIERIWEFDFIKGLAVCGMIVYHFFYLLDFFGIRENDIRQGGWAILARAVQITFLLVVGMLMAYSSRRHSGNIFLLRQWRRAAILLFFGLMITAVTALLVPEMYVRFGILHCIAAGIFLLSFIAAKKYFALLIALFFLALGFVSFPSENLAPFVYIAGWLPEKIASIDYFPLFPWTGVIAFGIFLGHVWNQGNLFKTFLPTPNFFLRTIAFLGQHSLIIYLLNVPLLIVTLWLLGLIPVMNFREAVFMP